MNTFDFNGHPLRTIEIDGAPWFAAVDLCVCLGHRIKPGVTSASDYLDGMPMEDRRVVTRNDTRATGGKVSPLFEGTRASRLIVVNEAGLYGLTMRAQRTRPEVAKFQDWVTRDVLPSIRKTGGYLLNEAARPDTSDAMPTVRDIGFCTARKLMPCAIFSMRPNR